MASFISWIKRKMMESPKCKLSKPFSLLLINGKPLLNIWTQIQEIIELRNLENVTVGFGCARKGGSDGSSRTSWGRLSLFRWTKLSKTSVNIISGCESLDEINLDNIRLTSMKHGKVLWVSHCKLRLFSCNRKNGSIRLLKCSLLRVEEKQKVKIRSLVADY